MSWKEEANELLAVLHDTEEKIAVLICELEFAIDSGDKEEYLYIKEKVDKN